MPTPMMSKKKKELSTQTPLQVSATPWDSVFSKFQKSNENPMKSKASSLLLSSHCNINSRTSGVKFQVETAVKHWLSSSYPDGPTPVQAASLPLLATTKDVVVEAVTGSGKTIAFAVPTLLKCVGRIIYDMDATDNDDHYDPASELIVNITNKVLALVIAPTRELASQIYSVFTPLLDAVNNNTNLTSNNNHPRFTLRHALFIGGNSHSLSDDVKQFQSSSSLQIPNILIGTPGRLDDLLKKSGLVDTRHLEVLILDEADRLLDMGFEKQLASILTRLPKQRRTGLFSATMTDALSQLVRTGLRNPVRVVVKVTQQQQNNQSLKTIDSSNSQQRTPTSLDIAYLITNHDSRLSSLIQIICMEMAPATTTSSTTTVSCGGKSKFIIYFATCACVDFYYKVLKSFPALKGVAIFSLHGKMDPKRRQAVYESYTLAPTSILLATDIAARGLDIPSIDMVLHYDPPQDPAQFAHRCGRAGRCGRLGKAVALLSPTEGETFVEFIKIRGVFMRDYLEFNNNSTVIDKSIVTAHMRSLVLADRDTYDKSIRAFVSWVRAYKEHQAQYIFRLKDVDLGAVARSFSLFRMPSMPEIRGGGGNAVNLNGFLEDKSVNINDIKYKDAARERRRLTLLSKSETPQHAAAQVQAAAVRKQQKVATAPWSQQTKDKEKRLERRGKRAVRKTAILKAKAEGTYVHHNKKRDRLEDGEEGGGNITSSDSDGDDWDELQKEARLMKKAKKSNGGGKKKEVFSSDDDHE